MYSLQNDKVKVSFDEQGFLQELVNLETGFNYAGGHPVWRLVFQRGKTFELEVNADTQPKITCGKEEIILAYPDNLFNGEVVRFAVTVKVKLEEDNVQWSIELANDEPDCVIRDLFFPVIHDMQLPETHELITSAIGGKKIKDIRGHVKAQHSYWKGMDHLFIQFSQAYPRPCATDCFAFAGEDDGFYYGMHAKVNEETNHIYRMYGDKLEVCMGKYPSCECGRTWSQSGYVTSPYNGSWHTAAKKYRAWLDHPECAWFELHESPEWVKRMTGWQRIIMKHQYGEIHYDYSQLKDIRKDGQECGIDALFMFGWQNGGHDNNYPDYTYDPELGTEKDLIAGVEEFNKNDGEVILYSNGQLMDLNSDFYKKRGHDIAIKDFNGNTRRDAYLFRSTGQFYGYVANRAFEHACPYSMEWEEVLKGVIDIAAEFGCKAAFFDQLGMAPNACCDPTHEHDVPALDLGAQRGRQLKRLREHARNHSPEMAVGVEHITDVVGCQSDFIHSLSGFCKAMNDWEDKGEKPELEFFIDWFRYIFPEIILSDREIRDDSDIERRVNHALMKGLRSDVEIYRCRKTISETPHYKEYLGKINRLRKKYADILLLGKYCDTDNFIIDNDEVEARSFVNGDTLAVVMTQSHLESAKTNLSVPGYEYIAADGLNGVEVIKKDEFFHVELKKHGIAVIIYKKCHH